MSYCRDCASGALHGGTPTGTVKASLHGLPTYVAEPEGEPKGVVVIIADAFGWELVNNRILADNIAKKGGFKVLLPDFFDGHWIAHDLLYSVEDVMNPAQKYLKRFSGGLYAAYCFAPFLFFNRFSVTKPRVYNFFRELRASTTLRIGAAGYCWGGKWVTTMCHGPESGEAKTFDGKPLLDAGFTAHPSFLNLPGDAEPIRLPYSLAHPTNDMNITPPEWEKFKKALEGKTNVEYQIYEGAKHGFAVRGNPDDETEKRQGMEAEEQAIRWFEKHLIPRSKL